MKPFTLRWWLWIYKRCINEIAYYRNRGDDCCAMGDYQDANYFYDKFEKYDSLLIDIEIRVITKYGEDDS